MSNLIIPDKFQHWFSPHGLKKSPYKYAWGGRAGGKSYFFATMCAMICLQRKVKFMCVRQFASSLAESVYPLIQEMSERFFPNEAVYYNNRIEYPRTGSVVLFAGLDRSIGSVKSTPNIDYCWIEEGSYIKAVAWEVLEPTVMRNPDAEMWVSLNPDNEDDPLIRDFLDVETLQPLDRDDTMYCNINYYDNPFLVGHIKTLAERMRVRDYSRYEHIYLGGLNRVSDAQVFNGKFAVDRFEAPEDVEFYHGLDWGTTDPNAWVRCYIQGDALYVDYACFVRANDYEELAERIVSKLPTCKDWKTYADSARPEGINYMRKKGFNVWSVGGKTSIEAGVTFLRSFRKIYIHERNAELIKEFTNYKYKLDSRTGDVTPVIVDKYNHGIDAIRYALHPLVKRGKYE